MTTRVLGYGRTSTNDQDLGIEKQKRKIDEICEDKGYELEKVYTNQISGMVELTDVLENHHDSFYEPVLNLSNRPELEKAFHKAQMVDAEKLIVFNPSRLARKLLPKLLIEKIFEEAGIEVEYVEVPDSWVGKMVEFLMDEAEVRRIQKKTREGLEQKDDDEWKGRVPVGFETVEEHNKLELADYFEDLKEAVDEYEETEKSRREVAEEYGEEVTESRIRSFQRNKEKGRPKEKYVKTED